MEKHQYDFSIMNFRTGRCTRKSFWGSGATEEECKKDALRQANAYANQKTDEAYRKAYRKACMRDSSGYRPSRSSYKFKLLADLFGSDISFS